MAKGRLRAGKWPPNGLRMGLRGWFWVNSALFFKLNPFKTVLDPSSAGKWPKIAKTKMYILVSSQIAATNTPTAGT